MKGGHVLACGGIGRHLLVRARMPIPHINVGMVGSGTYAMKTPLLPSVKLASNPTSLVLLKL